MKCIVVMWHLIWGEKFLKCGQVFLILWLMTSRGQNKIMKSAIFFRNCVFVRIKVYNKSALSVSQWFLLKACEYIYMFPLPQSSLERGLLLAFCICLNYARSLWIQFTKEDNMLPEWHTTHSGVRRSSKVTFFLHLAINNSKAEH